MVSRRLFITILSRQPFASVVPILELGDAGDRAVWISPHEMQTENTLPGIRRLLGKRGIVCEECPLPEVRALAHVIQAIKRVAQQNRDKRVLYIANGGPKLTAAAAQEALARRGGDFIYNDPRYPVLHVYDSGLTRWTVCPLTRAHFSLNDLAEVYSATVTPIADDLLPALSAPRDAFQRVSEGTRSVSAATPVMDPEDLAAYCLRLQTAVLTLRARVRRLKLDPDEAAARFQKQILSPFRLKTLAQEHRPFVLQKVIECTTRLMKAYPRSCPPDVYRWFTQNAIDIVADIAAVVALPKRGRRQQQSTTRPGDSFHPTGAQLERIAGAIVAQTIKNMGASWVVLQLLRRVVFQADHSWNPAAGVVEADLVLLLRSGRVLAIECKGGAINWAHVLRGLYRLRLATGRLTATAVCVPHRRGERGLIDRSPIEGIPVLTLNPSGQRIERLAEWLSVHGVMNRNELRRLFERQGAKWMEP